MKVVETFRPLSNAMTIMTIVLATFVFSNSSQGKLSQQSQELIAQVTTHRNQGTYQAYTERVLGMDNLITITNFILLDKKIALKNSFFPNTTKFTQTDNKLCMSFPTMPKNNEIYQQYGCMWI